MPFQYTVTKTVLMPEAVMPIPDPTPVVVPPDQPQKDAIIQINSANVKGEPGTGFEKRHKDGIDGGAFECGNCEYFEANLCRQEDMKRLSTQPRSEDGRVITDRTDCCDYLSRISLDDDDDDDDSKGE